MERTATHDAEYVDIVLGYHHILLFSVIFGLLIFGTGFFIGYYRARSDEADRAASATTTSPPASSTSSELPPVQIPAMLTQPPSPESGDVVKDMEGVSTGALAPVVTPEGDAAATAQQSAPAAAPPAPSREAATAPPPAPPSAQPAAAPTAEPPQAERQPPANGNGSQPATKPEPRAAASPANASGNIYLQVSSFDAAREAEQLINDLATEGFRALIDGQLVEGRHTVLVGPFSDFKSAAGRAKELKERNREAFPVRR